MTIQKKIAGFYWSSRGLFVWPWWAHSAGSRTSTDNLGHRTVSSLLSTWQTPSGYLEPYNSRTSPPSGQKGMVSEWRLKTYVDCFFRNDAEVRTYLVEPVVELLGAGLAAEVASRASKLSSDAFLTELVTVVTAYTLQTQPLDKILLKQQLTPWNKKWQCLKGVK